jgi:hypothetical protein
MEPSLLVQCGRAGLHVLERGEIVQEQTKSYKQNALHEDGVEWFNVFPVTEKIEAELVA